MGSASKGPKVASITVIVDDSPVVMVFSNIQAALKLKRRLREVFPDTVFSKGIEDKMVKDYARKVAGFVVQKKLFIRPSLAEGDTRIELPVPVPMHVSIQVPMQVDPSVGSSPVICPIDINCSYPDRYKAVLVEQQRDADGHADGFCDTSITTGASGDAHMRVNANVHAIPQVVVQQAEAQQIGVRADGYGAQIFAAGGANPAVLATVTPATATALTAVNATSVANNINAVSVPSVAAVPATAATAVTTGSVVGNTGAGTQISAASIIPLSIQNNNSITAIASAMGQGGTNPANISILNLSNPAGSVQNINANMQGIAQFSTIQAQQIRAIPAIATPVQMSAIAGQQGYVNAIGGGFSVPQAYLNPSYSGIASATQYPNFIQAQPYVTATPPGQISMQQIASVMQGHPGQVQGKMTPQQINIMSVPIQTMAAGSTMIPVSFQAIGMPGTQTRIPGFGDMAATATTTAVDQIAADTTNLKDVMSYSGIIPVNLKPIHTDPDHAADFHHGISSTFSGIPFQQLQMQQMTQPQAQQHIKHPQKLPETFYPNNRDILTLSVIPLPFQKDPGTGKVVSKLLEEWNEVVEKDSEQLDSTNKASDLSTETEFSQYYQKVTHQQENSYINDTDVHDPLPLMAQVSLMLRAFDYMFSKMSECGRASWNVQRQALLDSLSSANSVAKLSTAKSKHVHGSTSEAAAPPPAVAHVLKESEMAVGAPLALQPINQGTSSVPGATVTQLLPNNPLIPDVNHLAIGQELLDASPLDAHKLYSQILSQSSAANSATNATTFSNTATMLQYNINAGGQEAIAQILSHLNFTRNKSSAVVSIENALNNHMDLVIEYKMSLLSCIFPPTSSLKVDVLLLLHMLAIGTTGLRSVLNDSSANGTSHSAVLDALHALLPPGYDRKSMQNRYIALCTRLINIYQTDASLQAQVNSWKPSQSANVREMIEEYVREACRDNFRLKETILLMQSNSNSDKSSEKSVVVQRTILLDKVQILSILCEGNTENDASIRTERDVDALLESITFLERHMARADMVQKNTLVFAPPDTTNSLETEPTMSSESKRRIRL